MALTCSVFIATSLDGFVAREDGSIDWLEAANARLPPGEDCGYREFVAGIDALVLGRRSFEKVLTFERWPYGELPVLVLSRRPLALPEGLPPTVGATQKAPAEIVARFAADGARHLYVDGGQTVQSFLAAGLIDDLTITVVPVLLGQGRPLFGPLTADVELVHLGTRSWPFGFVQSRYRVVGPRPGRG
ncbi:MAG: dihydrofolate reductase family protein [Thermoanaerobaculia bacterium]|nr:dihydrofolate reductase family protein [Thermoanaerobaculia bacterium]MCZ7652866.1 dihydrofolate reductase family protein [Thermoanaerobaculia bacterium]